MRTLATQLDRSSRVPGLFQTRERPKVGPEPEIERSPRKISPAEAKKAQIKRAYNDGRKETGFTKEAEAIREKVHNLSKQGSLKQSRKQSSKRRPK